MPILLYPGVLAVSSFVILIEYTTAMYRAKIGIHSFNFWSAAFPILAFMGYLFPNWRDLLLASAVMGTPAIFYWW